MVGPLGDSLIITVDAARDDFIVGIGYTFSGAIELENKKYIRGNHTSMVAEYYALVEAARLATVHYQNSWEVTIYTDCEPLVSKMCGSEPTWGDWEDRREGCMWMMNKFDSWDILYRPRSNHGRAHRLAREALFEGRKDENLL